MLDKVVYNALCPYAIKRFLKDNGISYKDDNNDEAMLALLNNVSEEKLNIFLINSLQYGLQRNIYISKIKTFTKSLDKNNIKDYIKALNFINCDLVSEDNMFIKDIKSKLETDKKHLIYYDINIDSGDKISSINLVVGEGFEDRRSKDNINLYYSICIDISNNILIIRLRNFETAYEDYNIDNRYFAIKDCIRNILGIVTDNRDELYMQLMYRAVSDLTDSILSKPYKEIEQKIGKSINDSAKEWNKLLLDNKITEADNNNIVNSIINSYCKMKMRIELKEISVYDLKEKYDVDGYVRSIHFIDDSVSKINTQSKDVEEPLLDTSSFYDIKSSLDHSKKIKNTNIQWILENKNRLNTTFINERGGRFKVVIKSNHFNKEVNNYVLQKVIKYTP